MRYRLIGNNDINNIIKTTLNNRGINDWHEYLNITKINDDEYNGLDNIEDAIKCFASHVERGSEVGILFDTDT